MYPRNMNHIGLTVTDIEEAVSWYQAVLGFTLVMPPIEAKDDGGHFADIISDIFGNNFDSLKLAHLATGDGIGVELFEFSKPKSKRSENNFEFWKTGIFHLCVTDPEIELLAERIDDTGGRQRSKVWKLWPDKPYRVCYCEDPWGNVVEISSHSYEQTWANYHNTHKP